MARYRNKNMQTALIIVLIFVIFTAVLHIYNSSPANVPSAYHAIVRPKLTISTQWLNFFDSFSFTVPVIIVDVDLLRSINERANAVEKLNRKLTIAVDDKYRGAKISSHDYRLDVIYYSKTAYRRDYWKFEGQNQTRALLPFDITSSSFVSVPSDIRTFLEDWMQSTFMECHDILKRDPTEKRMIPLSFLSDMAELRDFVKERGARVILAGGTLLGWYRECSLIPHTTDVDFFLRAEEYNPAITADIDASDSPYSFIRIYGKPSDSYELTVKVKKTPGVNIDLFYLYTTENESYIGGLDWYKRKKFKWSYPRVTSLCTADLLGHLFHVPCNVVALLDMEYANWRVDHRSENFVWYQSHTNVKENGEYTKEEMRGMRLVEPWDDWIWNNLRASLGLY